MNLIPAEYQKALFYERARHLILFIGLRFAFGVFVTLTLLLPTYFFLAFQERELRREAEVLAQSSRLQELQGLEADIKDFNDILAEFEKASMIDLSLSDVLQDIVARSSLYVEYQTFVYDAKERRIDIKGEVATRNVLLEFIEKIKESAFVKHVDSPISNLLEGRDVVFSITIFLNDPS